MYSKKTETRGGVDMKTYLRVLEAIESAGVRAWLVGDPVRDVVMGIYPLTLSVVTEPCDLNVLLASLGRGAVVGSEAFPVLRTAILGSKVEISCMKTSSIEDDLARRDFSMNAIAIRSDGGFVDPFGGRHDIRNQLIRLTGDDINLVESDPIRIVRMLRFAAELDMDIFWKSETDVHCFIKKSLDSLRNAPAERWGREILNGMRRRPYDFIYLCDRYHLTPLFLEDLEHLKEIYIEGGKTLFDHTLDTVKIVQDFLARRKRRENDIAFSLVSLFHHASSGLGHSVDAVNAADIALRYLKSWNVDSAIGDSVVAVIQNYRLPYVALSEEELCRAALKHGIDVLEMIVDFAICNSQADNMKNMDVLAANKWKLGEVLRRFDEAKRRTSGSMRYLTGEEVMEALKLRPGKVVGEILGELDLAVGTGIVSNKKEATDWISRRASGN